MVQGRICAAPCEAQCPGCPSTIEPSSVRKTVRCRGAIRLLGPTAEYGEDGLMTQDENNERDGLQLGIFMPNCSATYHNQQL